MRPHISSYPSLDFIFKDENTQQLAILHLKLQNTAAIFLFIYYKRKGTVSTEFKYLNSKTLPISSSTKEGEKVNILPKKKKKQPSRYKLIHKPASYVLREKRLYPLPL